MHVCLCGIAVRGCISYETVSYATNAARTYISRGDCYFSYRNYPILLLLMRQESDRGRGWARLARFR